MAINKRVDERTGIEVGSIFQNDNGSDYVLVDVNGEYCLVMDIKAQTYVVVWLMTRYANGMIGWGQGHYFMFDLKGAVDFLYEKR